MNPRAKTCVVLVTLAGCAGTRPVAIRAPAPPSPEVPAVVLVDEYDDTDATRQAEPTRYFRGNVRVEVRGDETVFAEQEPGGAIAHATRTDAGWVFLLEDGRVTVSDGFLGPMQTLGRLSGGFTQGLPSIGRAAYLVSGRLWTCDGRTVALANVLGLPVRGAMFRDAMTGVAVLNDGALARTTDGVRWERVNLAGDVAWTVEPAGDRPVVRLLRRWVTVEADGTLTDATRPREPNVDPAAQAMLTMVGRAIRRHIAERVRVRLADGLWASPSGNELTVWSGHDTPRTLNFSHPLEAWGRWGDALVLEPGGEHRGWMRLGARGALSLVVGPNGSLDHRGSLRDAVWSDDGRHAAREGACPPDPTAPAAASDEGGHEDGDGDGDDRAWGRERERHRRVTALCVLQDGVRRWHTVALPDAQSDGVRWTLVGMHGARGLLRNALDPTEFTTWDTQTGATATVRFDDPSVEPQTLGWMPDGELCGTGVRCGDGCASVVLLGAPERPLAVLDAPDSARHVSFADGLRGAALSGGNPWLWRTVDGGHHWQPVPVDRGLARRDDPTIACDAVGCATIEPTPVRIVGWGPIEAAVRGEAAVPELRAPPSSPAAEMEPVRTPELACEAVGAARRSPWAIERLGETAGRWPDGVWAIDPGTRRIRWRGVAGDGEATLPTLAEPEPWRLVWATERAALAVTEGTTRWHWLSAAGARDLHRGAQESLPEGHSSRWEGARTGDGGAALLTTTGYVRPLSVVTVVDRDGVVRASRGWLEASDDRHAVALAQRGGRWGRVVAIGSAARFEPVDGGVAEDLPPWRGRMTVCAGPTPTSAVVLRAGESDGLRPGRLGEELYTQQLHVVVELSAAGACVRSQAATLERGLPGAPEASGDRAPREAVLRLDATPAGEMTGFADDGAQRVALRCTVR